MTFKLEEYLAPPIENRPFIKWPIDLAWAMQAVKIKGCNFAPVIGLLYFKGFSKEDTAQVSHKKLAEISGLSISTVRRSLKLLINKGLLESLQVAGSRNRYKFILPDIEGK